MTKIRIGVLFILLAVTVLIAQPLMAQEKAEVTAKKEVNAEKKDVRPWWWSGPAATAKRP